jgi:hypothetical protein
MNHLTKHAKGQECTIRLPYVCNHNPETVVACHINGVRFGHGVGIKTGFFAFGCSNCHDAVDSRVPITHMTWEEIRIAHLEGVLETQMKLKAMGVL